MEISLRKQAFPVALLISSVLFITTSAATHLHLNDNYMVTYNVVNNSTITFLIEAPKVAGWVGIGINVDKSNMDGADLFIGGYANNTSYGYGFKGKPIPPFTNDTELKYTCEASEVNGTTTVNVTRPLLGGSNSVNITDRVFYLLWSFNTENDHDGNLTGNKHTQRGNCALNLIKGEECAKGGATLLSVGVGTLMLSLVATVWKY